MTKKQTVVLLDRIGFDEHRTFDGVPLIDPDAFYVHVLSMHGLPLTAKDHEVVSQQNIDLFDEIAISQLLDEIESDYGIDFVVSLDEEHQIQCANLREQYSCFGRSPEDISLFRNKLKMKIQLDGVVTLPTFTVLSGYGDAMAFVARHGKSIIKPITGLGSERTYIIYNAIDLRLQLGDSSIKWADYEIETFIEGNMLHIDALIKDKNIVVTRISKYVTSTLDYTNGEPLVAFQISTEDVAYLKSMNLLTNIMNSMNIQSGVVHLEAFDTGAPELTFCEIGLRPGGGGVRSQFHATTGCDLFSLYLTLELGQDVACSPEDSDELAGYVLFPPQNGAVKSISDLDDFSDSWIVTKRIFADIGDQLSSNSCCLGKTALFTVTANDAETLHSRLISIRERFRLDVSTGCCA